MKVGCKFARRKRSNNLNDAAAAFEPGRKEKEKRKTVCAICSITRSWSWMDPFFHLGRHSTSRTMADLFIWI